MKKTVILVTLIIAIAVSFIYFRYSNPVWSLKLELKINEDKAQPLGTLFSLKNKYDKTLYSAGFQNVFNSYLPGNRRVLSFSANLDQEIKIKTFDRVFDDNLLGARLMVFKNILSMFFKFRAIQSFFDFNPISQQWVLAKKEWYPNSYGKLKFNTKTQEWSPSDQKWDQAYRFGGVTSVENKPLVFFRSAIKYGDREVFKNEKFSYHFYYASGVLSAYKKDLNDPTRSSFIHCVWHPRQGPLKEKEACTEHPNPELSRPYPMDHSEVLSFGIFKNQILISMNNGIIYAMTKDQLKVVFKKKSERISWQGYNMLTWNDVLLIGQYPSGNLYFYDGNEIKPFVPAIPFKKYKSEVGREAQTLAIYNGKLFVGVWPWGETWIFDEDQQKWQKGPRLFENPQSPSGEEAFLEPYHKEIFELNLKNKVHDNFWGQRINGMVVFNDSLFASTQNKYGQPYIPEIHGKILSKKEALQYGKVHKLTGSPQTSCQINMKPITTLEFRSERSRLLIIQDGVLLCQTPIKSILSRYLGQTKLILGEGIYGKFPGVITLLYQE